MKIEEQRRYIHKVLNDMKIDDEDKFMSAVANVIHEDSRKIQSQQSELEKKDKIINLMANFIDDVDKDDKICLIIGEEVCNTFENGILNCIECIKQYFERRAEE